MQVNGDAFLGRTYDNGDDFKRLDFKMSEVSSSAPWVQVTLPAQLSLLPQSFSAAACIVCDPGFPVHMAVQLPLSFDKQSVPGV